MAPIFKSIFIFLETDQIFFIFRFQSAMSVPHMLGNQLNPNSSMAQKMHDSLNQEVEAHSIYSESNSNTNLVGPQLHSRVIASVRNSIFKSYSKFRIYNAGQFMWQKIDLTSSKLPKTQILNWDCLISEFRLFT